MPQRPTDLPRNRCHSFNLDGPTMSEKILLLIRHGATPANTARPYTLQGLLPDPDLNEEGLRQAEAAARAVARWPLTRIFTSPLRRAQQTAQVIADQRGLPLEVVPALVEVDVGLWSGLTWEEVERRWPNEHRAFHDDPERHGYLKGENLGQVRDRVLPELQALIDRSPESAVLVVSHGVVNRVLLAHWIGIPLRYARQLPQDNGGINVVRIHQNQVKVRTVNAADHLFPETDQPTAGYRAA
jgi:broad specificity phosphatase PhoE